MVSTIPILYGFTMASLLPTIPIYSHVFFRKTHLALWFQLPMFFPRIHLQPGFKSISQSTWHHGPHCSGFMSPTGRIMGEWCEGPIATSVLRCRSENWMLNIYHLEIHHGYGKSQFLMGKFTISMVMFNSYAKKSGKYLNIKYEQNLGTRYSQVEPSKLLPRDLI